VCNGRKTKNHRLKRDSRSWPNGANLPVRSLPTERQNLRTWASAIDVFGRGPLSRASRPFIVTPLKARSGSTAADPGAYDLGRSLNGGGRRSMRAARWQGCTAQGSKVLAIFLSLLPKSCYGASFGQKRPPGGGVFNEAGMFDRTTVGRARGGAQAGESGHKEKMALGVRASP